MTVQELIELLQQMPPNACVEIGTEEPVQTEPTCVTLERRSFLSGDAVDLTMTVEHYVFIGDY